MEIDFLAFKGRPLHSTAYDRKSSKWILSTERLRNPPQYGRGIFAVSSLSPYLFYMGCQIRFMAKILNAPAARCLKTIHCFGKWTRKWDGPGDLDSQNLQRPAFILITTSGIAVALVNHTVRLLRAIKERIRNYY
jgi:hypothetical protein